MRQRAGMPKYKKKREALPTLNYTRRGFRLKDGRLHLAGGIVVTVVWSRDLPGRPSSVRVYRDSIGHWYASFVVPAETEPLPETGAVIGIDWGVKETATTTSRRPRPSAPAARQEGRAAPDPLRPDDGPPQARRRARPRSKGYREAKRRRRSCTRRSPGSGRTPPASGPRRSSATTTPSPSRTSGRSSSPSPPWPARPLTPRSAPRRRP